MRTSSSTQPVAQKNIRCSPPYLFYQHILIVPRTITLAAICIYTGQMFTTQVTLYLGHGAHASITRHLCLFVPRFPTNRRAGHRPSGPVYNDMSKAAPAPAHTALPDERMQRPPPLLLGLPQYARAKQKRQEASVLSSSRQATTHPRSS